MKAEYVYFMEEGGRVRFLTDPSDREKALCEIGFVLRIRLDFIEASLHIQVPETIGEKPVRFVGIFPELPQGCDIPELGFPPIKYLYIPSGVRHLRITAGIKRTSVPASEAIEKYNLLGNNECMVEISPDNPHFRVHDHGIYSRDMKQLFYIFAPGESFEIPMGVKTVHGGAGCALKGVRRLTVPESVRVISKCPFEGCVDLEEVVIRAGSIGTRAFFGCCSLSNAVIAAKEIGDGAFFGCTALKNVTLADTEIIGEDVFGCCNALEEIELPDTLKNVKNNAFLFTNIRHLTIPPGVRELGNDIIGYDLEKNTILEIYSNNGFLPFKRGIRPAENGVLLLIISAQTNNVLYGFVLLGDPSLVLTEHDVDFKEYDKIFRRDTDSVEFDPNMLFNAAWARLINPVGMNEETLEFFKDYVAERAEFALIVKICSGNMTAGEAAAHPFFDLVDNDRLLNIIDESARAGKTEITAVLMQKMHERRSRE